MISEYLNISKKIVWIITFSFFISCSSNSVPCTNDFNEPILSVRSVYSAETGMKIDTVTISNVKIDSIYKSPVNLTREISNNIIVRDSLMICTIPCGFGTQEGIYEYTFSAKGYMDFTLSSFIEYGEKDINCASRNSFGQPIGFSMQPNLP